MKFCFFALAVAGIWQLSAETPNLSGVWKTNPEKSKAAGTPPKYLMILEQRDSKLSVKMALESTHGVERSSYTFNLDGSPAINSYRGLPMRTIASWNEGVLKLDSKTAGRPSTITQTFSLSADGTVLTVENAVSANGQDIAQTLVFDKQPEEAGEVLRKPEEKAGATFKNVQILKDMPASDFLNAMRSFSMSLGTGCDFCHVAGKFEAEDKPAKAMARKMITMTRAINDQNFGGQQEVRCFTCHQGQQEPKSRPAF